MIMEDTLIWDHITEEGDIRHHHRQIEVVDITTNRHTQEVGERTEDRPEDV